MASSKPAVVTSAVRAPLRSSSVLVPTVVPWRRMNSPVGGDLVEGFDDGLRGIGGSGEYFQHAEVAVRSIQTQSVKVPPVSMAMRRG